MKDILDHFNREFLYNDWANWETADSVGRLNDPPVKAQQYLAHIVAAEWLWLERLKAEKQRMAVWPELNVEQCCSEFVKLSREWKEYLKALTHDSLGQEVAYVNSKGESWSNSVHDILAHLLIHSASHRGQIAAAIRAAGHTPAYTDYIHWARNQLHRSI